MQGTPGDFRLYHSNALDVLAELLAEALREPAPGQALLAPDTLLIPQAAMRRWLQATLAQRHGVAANLEFLTPGEFVARALDANPGPGQAPGKPGDDLDVESLHWRLYAALSDPKLRALPAMAKYAAYLADDDAAKAWALAGELAAVFEKYSAWRRDWLLRWDDGADRDDPQAILWRAVAAGRAHRARRIQDYLARFVDGDARPSGLPPRLFAFATLNVSPDVLRVIASQSRVGTLHFYLPTPTKEYWGDLRTLGARLRAGEDPFADEARDNPLLRDWGAAGKDFMALLGGYEVVHPSGEIAAYVDPERAQGALRDSLLQRMRADLFHRRGEASGARRAAVERADPSLQFHACHTRLRELQVLHDRLRALLEDERFDPPLQPREIAVLAPDIDLYAPYLDAVFGDQADAASGQAIPYALADASPLAGEALAEVFLRLLALPVSRFGLEEILDLLASPPLAEAAGLDADDFERLHGWLHDAGARWGLDAAHRARSGAPEDDAYTWQFALDRLLLGHASGDDAAIGAVAPWPRLEGGALDALDRLLRLLRELARRERRFGAAMPPAQWRESLLRMLDALLPTPPASASGQRALERLRALIDAFANAAARAGFDAPVPVEAVRAHFAGVLAEADVRAPLLTGGVSFARMVPMRLLPFRAICLLGMNDGDYPRRDPAAGLNRLVAELGNGQRRAGDRSTRDDDRYLFLQLFSAAQDVFYLSWLGADPRDGSVREPSALVGELLAAAGAYHVRPERAEDELVLRHPLQPFSPQAFGGSDEDGTPDPRVFTYRGSWHPAAGRLSGARAALPPWMPAANALPAPRDAEGELSLDALRRFLLDPAGQFLRQRLDIRLAEIEDAGEDIEPLQAPGHGLQRNRLQRAAFDALLAGDDEASLQASLRARALLPSGAAGRRALAAIVREVRPYADAFAHWRRDAESASLPVEVDIDGLRLHGRIGDAWPQGIARLRFGKPNGPSSIRNGLDWLLARAAGVGMPFVEFHETKDAGIGPHERVELDPTQAKDALRVLLALRSTGLRQPRAVRAYSGWNSFAADGSGAACARRREPLARRNAAGPKATAMRCGWPSARDPFADAAEAGRFARSHERDLCSGVQRDLGAADNRR
ncbi:MAG: exodeoxyribonuclease V subunit gamma [Lysobacterales bacterium]